MKDRFNGLQPFMQLVVLILIGAVAFIFLSITIASVVSAIYPDMPVNNMAIQQDKYPVQFMMMYYFPFQVGFLLVPGLLFLCWCRESQLFKKPSVSGSLWSILLFISVFLLLPFLSEINNWITEYFGLHGELMRQKLRADAQMQQLLGSTNEVSFVMGLIIIGLITGVAEELAFRRLLFSHMLSYTKQFWLSLIGSSFVFAILHFNYLQFIPLMTFGIALGLIYYYSGSIWLGAGLHALNNVINLWWLSTDSFPSWMETVDLKLTIPSTLLLMGLLYYQFFRKRTTA